MSATTEPRVLAHGTETTYRYYGCRCEECRAGRAERARARRLEIAAGQPPRPRKRRPVPDHGTPARYQRGCRCDECREARREQNRAYKERKRTGAPAPVHRCPVPAPCERLHAEAVLDVLEARARVLEKAVARRHPGAAQRRVEVLQLLAALKRHGVTR